MLSVYKRITGKNPRTSVGAPGSALRGRATPNGPKDGLTEEPSQGGRGATASMAQTIQASARPSPTAASASR